MAIRFDWAKSMPSLTPRNSPYFCEGTEGEWKGCRGSGCAVCVEFLGDFPLYFRNHPNCLPASACEGKYFACSSNCPAPSETDTCESKSHGWHGCFHGGCAVCAELTSGYPNYFVNHPSCIPMPGRCGGIAAPCSLNCPRRHPETGESRCFIFRKSGYLGFGVTLVVVVSGVAGGLALARHKHWGLDAEADEASDGVKGPSELMLVARRGGRVAVVDRWNHELNPDDEVRMVVTSGDSTRQWLLIASVDGNAEAHVYFPYEGEKSTPIEHAGRWEVPGSIILDASPGPERFFAFFSNRPLDANQVKGPLVALAQRGWDAIRSETVVTVEGAVGVVGI